MIYAGTTLGHFAQITNAGKTKAMKIKSLTAAQIDIVAQHLSEAAITPSVSAKKVGDKLAQLLVAGIGLEHAALAFISIMSADTFDRAQGPADFGPEIRQQRTAQRDEPAVAEEPKAAIARQAQAILDQAQTGALSQAPDFSKPTHVRLRIKLAQIVTLAEVGDIAALQAFEISPVSSSSKAMARAATTV